MENIVTEGGRIDAALRSGMEGSALGIEVLAVLVIVLAIVVGTVRFVLHYRDARPDAYELYKARIARALQLGLEFLVAADIVRTVALQPTLTNVGVLAALVLVRTFLSWSLVVELEGRWPWQMAAIGSAQRE